MQIFSSTLLYVKIIDVGQIFRLCPLIQWQPSIASTWLTPGLLYRCGCRLLSSRSHRGLLVRFSLFNRMIFGFRGPPSGETTIVLVFGVLPLRGWVGASWLPTMASSFPLPCRIFRHRLMGCSIYCSSHIASLILLVVWCGVAGLVGCDPAGQISLWWDVSWYATGDLAPTL